MTTTEHLNFSVLSAPIASLDRRALSQAWYSALYGNHNAAESAVTKTRAEVEPARATRVFPAVVPAQARSASVAAPNPTRRVPARLQIAEPERRSPRSALARKIERALLQPRTGARKTSFAIRDGNGRVQVLLQMRGAQVRLIAICAPRATPRVAAALGQAQYALAGHGIELDAQVRSEASC